MKFLGDLALALGCTLAGVFAMSAAEFSFWAEYQQRHGFPSARQEGVTAIAGAAFCQTQGARVRASELLPRYGPPPNGNKLLLSYLSGMPRARILKIPKDGSAPRDVSPPVEGNNPRLLSGPRSSTTRRR